MCFIKKRWKRDLEGQQSIVSAQGLLSILNFEGKLVYEEIITATNDFNSKFFIGSSGYGNVYGVELSSEDI